MTNTRTPAPDLIRGLCGHQQTPDHVRGVPLGKASR